MYETLEEKDFMKYNVKIRWSADILFSFGMVQVVSDPMEKLNLEHGFIIKTHTHTHMYTYISIYICVCVCVCVCVYRIYM